jgi:hypothetical protein
MLYGRLATGVLAAMFVAPAWARADNIGWPQPDGPGSPVILTYSFSNLFDFGFNTALQPEDLREATVAALVVWSRYAPLNFVEVRDSGPSPVEALYPADGHANIRIGYMPTLPDSAAAHAHLPRAATAVADGLDGDVHLSNDLTAFSARTWGRTTDDPLALDFFSAMLHEFGHSLGIRHIDGAVAVMGMEFQVFPNPGAATLFPADIEAIRALYGAGRGAVLTLDGAVLPTPEPSSVVLIGTGLAFLARRVRRRNC